MDKITFIAEIGINHNGDLKIAKSLIENSKKAGFDYVKFQKRDIETVYSKEILDTLEKVLGVKQQKSKSLDLNLIRINMIKLINIVRI